MVLASKFIPRPITGFETPVFEDVLVMVKVNKTLMMEAVVAAVVATAVVCL
jgi:hypothetical protein